METEINLPKELEAELRKIVVELGFNGNSEFVEAAVKEKILELKKRQFFQISDKVAHGLKEKGVSSKEIMEEFED